MRLNGTTGKKCTRKNGNTLPVYVIRLKLLRMTNFLGSLTIATCSNKKWLDDACRRDFVDTFRQKERASRREKDVKGRGVGARDEISDFAVIFGFN